MRARPRERLWEPLCLNCGTSLERIAPESLTRSLSEFVHGHIWWHGLCAPQNRVSGQKGGGLRCWNGLTARPGAEFWGMEVGRRLRPAASLGFCRRLARLRHGNELRRLHDPEPDGGWNRNPIGHHHARTGDGGKPELDVAQLHEILDRGALGNVTRDWRKTHCAHHRHALVTSVRPHPLEPLESKLECG